jgi:DNA primase
VLEIERRERERMPSGKNGLIDKIKQSHDILQVFALYRPSFKPEKHLPYYTVICPFHEDHKPSMYLDGVRQLYKCHACGARGDVINLYAHFEGITIREAIARMAVSFQAVQS